MHRQLIQGFIYFLVLIYCNLACGQSITVGPDGKFEKQVISVPYAFYNLYRKMKPHHSSDRIADVMIDRIVQGNLKKLGMDFEKIVKMSDDDPGTVLYS